MCGIAGVYYFQNHQIDEDALHRMAEALRHRGPDEGGFYRDDRAGLASRRLKIIDLTKAGAQPMADESGRFHLIYNGEIYNFRKLRSELERKYRFFSNSDTEVILRLFQEYRDQAWRQLNGMFAIAIYDSYTHELFLARDHAGIKPLYYYRDTEKLVFASELKALFASSLVACEIDERTLGSYLQYGYFPGSLTPYRSIVKLRPGQSAIVGTNGIQLERYWCRENFEANSPVVDPEAALDRLLMTSVQQQMISDVPLGAFVSGGIDSSLIVAMMNRLTTSPIKTFTVGFSRMGYYDERPAARKVAQLFGTEHHEFIVEDRIDETLPQLVNVFDEPFADSSAIPTLYLAKLARNHVTVALSGTGGDEIFGGYRKYMAAQWASVYTALPASVRSAIQQGANLLPASRQSLWKERALLFQRFAQLQKEPELILQLNSIFSSDELKALVNQELTIDSTFGTKTDVMAARMMAFDYEFYLPDDLLTKEDRTTMAFGLEARVPFLDREIIEFMTSLPLAFKVSGRSTKRLFKKVAARYLPISTVERPKHGFGSPVAEWLRNDLRDLSHDILFASDAYLKSELIKQKWEAHQQGAVDQNRQLWAVLILELWMREVKTSAALKGMPVQPR